jgi:hypothetical protein
MFPARENLGRRLRYCLVQCLSVLVLITTPALAQKTAPNHQPKAAGPQDLNKYPGLLPKLGQLFQKLQRDVKFPPERSQSKLLPLLPESTIVYAALPNYGEAAHQALTILQTELQQSSVLHDWWTHGELSASGAQMEAELEAFHQLSQYLGDEIVISGAPSANQIPSLLVLAEVKKSGLKNFLQGMTKDLPGNKQVRLRVLYVQDLATAQERSTTEDLLILVRPDFVVGSLDVETLRKFNARIDAGRRDFASTPFGQKLTQAYEQNVTVVAAADVQQLLKELPAGTAQNRRMIDRTGFGDAQYLVLEHNRVAGQALSQATLSFTGPRHGIASWLAAPGPVGSLTFVSPQAMLAGAVLLKNPAEIFDDVRALAIDSNPNLSPRLIRWNMD